MTSRRVNWSHRVSIVILFSLAVLQPDLARAQEPVHTLQDLKSVLVTSDRVQVVGPDGKKVQGIVESVLTSSLNVRTGKVSREFRDSQIFEVRKQYNDPIWNGVKIGVVVGAITGTVLGAALSDAFCDGCGNNVAGGAVALGLMGAGIGAGTGALSDSLRHGYKPIYTAPKVTEKRFGVSPILNKNTRGVALALRF